MRWPNLPQLSLRHKIGHTLLWPGLIFILMAFGSCSIDYNHYLDVRKPEDAELADATYWAQQVKERRATAFEHGNSPEYLAAVQAALALQEKHVNRYRELKQYREDKGLDPGIDIMPLVLIFFSGGVLVFIGYNVLDDNNWR